MSPMLTPKIPGMATLPSDVIPPTLLVRIYGPSTSTLIARDEELRVLHTLSSDYGLGPRIEGTFQNGRVEQFFNSKALTAPELRDLETSRMIARRMRELHSVDLNVLGFEEREEPTVWQRIKEWYPLAVQAASGLRNAGRWNEWFGKFGLDKVGEEVEEYMTWVNAQSEKGQGRVFCRKRLFSSSLGKVQFRPDLDIYRQRHTIW